MASKIKKTKIGEKSFQDYRQNSLWRLTLRRIFHQRNALFGMGLIGFMILIAVFAPVIAPYDPLQVLIGIEDVKKRSGPCIHLVDPETTSALGQQVCSSLKGLCCPADQPTHLMGIDGNVRDQFSRVLYGARISLLVGVVTVSLSLTVGTILGSLAGFLGGRWDNIIMRLLDVLMAFPSLLLMIAIVNVLGRGIINALLAISIVSIPGYARIVRASVLSVKTNEYVAASKALGGSSMHVLFSRILPNAIPPLIVRATLGIGGAILETAALSFLGLGAQPPTPEWGTMLGTERAQVFTAPHLVFFPGFAIMLTVLGFNLLGDGLRDAIDPRLNQAGND
ncbi:MAG: ABC transporter permease [Anaerolineae bacterium]|nr:ABC transporter permease [Anaerolineae bacterium]